MLHPEWLLIPAAVVAFLSWALWKRLGADRMRAFNDARRNSSRLVGTGELVDGSRHMPVALSITDSTFFYENADLSASLDLSSVEEVEYENELLTGQPVATGKVMRLRCVNTVFEFVLKTAAVAKWQAVLPSVRLAQ